MKETDTKNRLRFLIQPGKRLSQRVVFAGAWMFFLQASARGLGMVRVIILARILAPEAFGLVSVALLTVELLNQLTATGFNSALIQRKGGIEDYLDTVWTMLATRGLLLSVIILAGAPLFAELFNVPEATSYVRAMAAVLAINGFNNTGIIYFDKELEAHKRFIWKMSGTLIEFVVAVAMALILRNAWAIVLGAISGGITGMVVSYFIHPYRPRVKFDLKKAKELFGFGVWVLFIAILAYTITRIDSVFVSRILGVSALGLYTMAHTIGDVISNEIRDLTQAVAFPALSKLQDNLPKLREAVLNGIEVITQVTLPVAVVIFVLAPDFIPIVLGDKWIPSVPALQILAFSAAVFSFATVGGTLFWAVGKPSLGFIRLLISSIIIVVLLIFFTKTLGLSGAAFAHLIGNGGGLLFTVWTVKKILKTSLFEVLKSFVSPVIISLVVWGSLVLVKQAVGQVGIGELLLLVCVAVISYIVSAVLLWRFFRVGPIQLLALVRSKI